MGNGTSSTSPSVVWLLSRDYVQTVVSVHAHVVEISSYSRQIELNLLP